MPKNRGDDLTEIHNEGAKDYTKGEYNPPTKNPVKFMIEGYSKEELEDIDAYNQGYSNAKDQDKGSGGCFLTTACVEHAGLADDCRELEILRAFRDQYFRSLDGGPAMLAEYYKVAPIIVKQIERSDECNVILASIYATIQKAVSFIEEGHNSAAFFCYKEMFYDLKRRYLYKVC